MILEDIEQGLGCALFDPHGDICDDVLKRIPENRINDVVLIDPSDIDFPIGFNLLEAKTEAQKIVLSSDIVSAFKRHATAWGDTMTSVLQNAVNTILENETNIYSSPSEEAPSLLNFAEGSLVTVLRHEGPWVLVRRSPTEVGWAKNENILLH